MERALILILLAILLVSGCVMNSNVPAVAPLSTETGTNIYANTNTYADAGQVMSELQMALASGGISPDAYGDINNKINSLESSGYNASDLRQILSQIPVGGQGNTSAYNEPEALQNASKENISSTGSQVVIWRYMNGKWTPNGKPPACPDPLVLQAPFDLKLATSILYPGQIRGGDFKPHGGFRIDGTSGGPVKVTAPLQGYIYNVARFYDEFGIHYMFDVQHPCGIMYRLGHLGAVPPKLEAIFDSVPENPKGDSRTHEVEPVFVELGETLATDTQKGSGFDWGVYDLRKENAASQDPVFREAHKDEPWQAYHAVCWFDYLPADQEQIVRSLPAADGISGKNSDYC